MSGIGRPVFDSGLFSFKGRRNRRSYFVAQGTVLLVLILVAGLFFESMDSISADSFAMLITLAFLLGVWINLSTSSQRLRDIGLSPWWVIGFFVALMIPFINLIASLWIIFWPGTDGPNKYGPNPLGTAGVSGWSESVAAGVSSFNRQQSESGFSSEAGQSGESDGPFGGADAKPENEPGKKRTAQAGEPDKEFFLQAFEELKSGNVDQALWIKCMTLENNDRKLARIRYVKERAAELAGSTG